jgi:capsular polysaccharide biosynthesis protein
MTEPRTTSPLAEYLAMVWQRKILVVLIVIALTVPAYFLSAAQQPVYTASTDVAVIKQSLDTNLNIATTVLSDTEMTSIVAAVEGDAVGNLARQRGATGVMTATTTPKTNLFTISVQDTDPVRAADTANIYADAYAQLDSDQQRVALAGARQQLQATVDRLQAQIDDLIARSASSSRLASGGAATSVLGSLQQQQSTLQNQIARLDITTALISGDTTVVRRAVPALESDSPRPFRDAAVAVLLGLVFGISIAIVLGSLQARQSAPGVTPPRPDEDENAQTESMQVNGHAPGTGNHQAGDPVPTNSGR